MSLYVRMAFFSIASLFFVVKQKTAYEMRISDWSSDVCSSDLHLADMGQELVAQPFTFRRTFHQAGDIDEGEVRRDDFRRPAYFGDPEQARVRHRQSGRASCRERVCQYV